VLIFCVKEMGNSPNKNHMCYIRLYGELDNRCLTVDPSGKNQRGPSLARLSVLTDCVFLFYLGYLITCFYHWKKWISIQQSNE